MTDAEKRLRQALEQARREGFEAAREMDIDEIGVRGYAYETFEDYEQRTKEKA